MLDLAKQVVRDGEGSTRVCVYTVTGALTAPEARVAARGVAENVLVKCALHGGDPNWGRILAALGAAGVHLDPDRVAVAVGGVPIVRRGAGVPGAEADARGAAKRRGRGRDRARPGRRQRDRDRIRPVARLRPLQQLEDVVITVVKVGGAAASAATEVAALASRGPQRGGRARRRAADQRRAAAWPAWSRPSWAASG